MTARGIVSTSPSGGHGAALDESARFIGAVGPLFGDLEAEDEGPEC